MPKAKCKTQKQMRQCLTFEFCTLNYVASSSLQPYLWLCSLHGRVSYLTAALRLLRCGGHGRRLRLRHARRSHTGSRWRRHRKVRQERDTRASDLQVSCGNRPVGFCLLQRQPRIRELELRGHAVGETDVGDLV